MKRRSPLEALAGIRKHETTLRAREKVERTEERRGAEGRLADAAGKRSAEQERRRVAAEAEAARLGAGRTRAGDLARAERFQSAARSRVEQHAKAESAAVREVAVAARKEQTAALAVARARRSEKAIDEHRERLRKADSRAADRREDEATADTHHFRRHGRERQGR